VVAVGLRILLEKKSRNTFAKASPFLLKRGRKKHNWIDGWWNFDSPINNIL
jgi:hypothetical protein